MALAAGTRLGVYEITGFLGAGGMGEVYRAKDTRLGRDVAIKILQDLTNADAERLARFEREARLLASLNHPHIGAIYGFEDAGALPALVLELVEGETLADRLRREPLPLKEALTIAAQIAEGLESAHERGIVHRDLKPANIKVSADGVVKVLDFGLAKAAGSDKSGHDQTDSPTITAEGTREGVILGTAAYMSPEQARGKPVDRRADIWAFGCVLYELLARRRAFEGQTATDTLVAILERDPHWQHLPHATPMSIRRLLRRCLEKDAKRRLRDIGDARLEIDEALSSPGDGQPASTRDHSALRFWRVTAVGAVLLAAAAGLTAYVARRPSQDAGSATTRMTASRLTSYSGRQYSATLAPDGRSFAFVSDHTGPPDIWLRQVFGGEPIRLTNDAWEEEDLAFAPVKMVP